jgi:hypothetical protein
VTNATEKGRKSDKARESTGIAARQIYGKAGQRGSEGGVDSPCRRQIVARHV